MSVLEKYTTLMAQENITVDFNDRIATADFNLETRVIRMPSYSWMDTDGQQTMISHEIGHALFSDWNSDELLAHAKKYKALFNVVEDIRIEKLLIRKFPGLHSTFINGYANLIKNNFFGDSEESNLVNRLNIYFKSRFHVVPEFSDIEKQAFAPLLKIETKEDVISICEKLLPILKEELKKEKEKEDKKIFENPDGKENNSWGLDYEDEDDKEEENSDSEIEIEANSSEIETGDENSEVSPEKEDTENSEAEPEVSDEGEESSDIPTNLEETDENSENTEDELDGLDDLTDFERACVDKNNEQIFLSAQFDVLPFSIDLEKLSGQYDRYIEYVYKNLSPAMRKRISFMTQVCKKSARAAVTVFEQLKSATLMKVKKYKTSGSINSRALYKYKLSDNPQIFKRKCLSPAEQNHAVTILIDYSSSIKDEILQILLNTTTLCEFCMAQKIPFEVIAFGFCRAGNAADYISAAGSHSILPICNNLNYRPEKILMLNSTFSRKTGFMFGSTPLFSALMAAMNSLSRFKKNGIDKNHLIIVTDGSPDDERDVINYDGGLFTSIANTIWNNKAPELRIGKYNILKNIDIKAFFDKYAGEYSRSKYSTGREMDFSFRLGHNFVFAAVFSYFKNRFNCETHINFVSKDVQDYIYRQFQEEKLLAEYEGREYNAASVIEYLQNTNRYTFEFPVGFSTTLKNVNIKEFLEKGVTTMNDFEYIKSYSWSKITMRANTNLSDWMRKEPQYVLKNINGALKFFSCFLAKEMA